MRDIDQRKGRFRMQAQDFLAQSASERGIEIRKRLVHQQNARLQRERSCQRDTLLLSARKFPRPDVQIVAKPDEVCDVVNTPVGILPPELDEREVQTRYFRQRSCAAKAQGLETPCRRRATAAAM